MHATGNAIRKYPRWAALLYIGLAPAGMAIHCWTVVIAYHASGVSSAILAFMIPVGAELFCVAKTWGMAGFATLYRLAVLACGALFFFAGALFNIFD